MIKNEEIEKLKKDLIFQPLNSVEELQDWLYLYFDIYFPRGVVSPNSSHGPADAMWRIYHLIKTGENIDIPEVVMRASRDSGKTLAAAALEVLLMIHFRISLCHMAAITSQSLKAIQYVELFFRKIKPYLIEHGWKQTSDNKRMIEFIDETGQNLYLKIIVATIAGANSEHVPVLFCLEGKTELFIENKNPKKFKNTGMRKRKVNTARGVYRKIKKGENVEILSFNHKTNNLEFKKCTNAKKSKKDVYRVLLENGKYLDATLDHRVFVLGKGYIPISETSIDDRMISIGKMKTEIPRVRKKKEKIQTFEIKENKNVFEEVLIGSLLGDGTIYRKCRVKYKNNAHFSENHCEEQREYLEWKNSVFLKAGFKSKMSSNSYSGFTGRKQASMNSGNNSFFNDWVDFKKTFHLTNVLDNLGPLALAVWYQDDGFSHGFRLCTHGFEKEQTEFLSNLINKKFGFSTWVAWENKQDGRSYAYIAGSVEDKYKLYRICGHLFHPTMRFKLSDIETKTIKNCKYCGDEFLTIETATTAICCSNEMCRNIQEGRVSDVKIKSIDFIKNTDVFDFTVEDNHNMIANSLLVHNCDEIDVVQDPRALEEAKMIPSSFKNIQPLMIYLSTLKFSGGLMQKTMDSVKKAGGEIYSWNILDITERIDPETAKVNEPKVVRYITTQLPMINISSKEFEALREEEKNKYERFEAYAGIAEHPMLPVMRNYLVDRPEQDKGGLFKKLQQTHNLFKKLSIDMADAQLLCNRPSSSNLVFPRFDPILNTLTIDEAWNRVTGEDRKNITYEQLRAFLLSLGATFIGGADWGYTDYTSLSVVALLPGGDTWLIDNIIQDKLELEDICKLAVELDNKWQVDKWYVDQAYPAYIATLRRKGLKIPEFTKTVSEGISALQSRIVDSNGARRFFVLDVPETRFALEAFGSYKWALDGKGEIIEGKPHHDRDGY
jgi:hypothetical protein